MTAAQKLLSAEDFLLWCLGREGRWELIDGVPVEMMAGASNIHDDIVVNILAALRAKLAGGPCRPRTADTAVRTALRKVRRPDVTIDCGPSAPDRYEAAEPVVVFEVLSPSTRTFDEVQKALEYARVASIRAIVLVDAERPRVIVRRRSTDGAWTDDEYTDLAEVITLDAVGVVLGLAEIYDSVAFTA